MVLGNRKLKYEYSKMEQITDGIVSIADTIMIPELTLTSENTAAGLLERAPTIVVIYQFFIKNNFAAIIRLKVLNI